MMKAPAIIEDVQVVEKRDRWSALPRRGPASACTARGRRHRGRYSLKAGAARPPRHPARGRGCPRAAERARGVARRWMDCRERTAMTDARKRLLAVLSDVAPDLAVALWNDRDIRALPRNIREAICDALRVEAARRGLDANEQPNDYGRELDELAALLLDDT